MSFAAPPPLRPGDLVRIVAPSGPLSAADLWPGLAWLRARYRLRVSPGLLAREGYLAGTDDRRHAELSLAMRDSEAKAVFVARGGYGATRILDSLPWDALRQHPKWLVGFSDVTALHVAAWGHSLASVHGPNVTGLGGGTAPQVRAALLAVLERPREGRTWRGLTIVRGGRAAGVLVGGNLSLLHAMAASRQLTVPDGAVLAVEDVNEAPYRLDRMLTSLRAGGYLARISAMIFGGIDRSAPGPDGWTAEGVIHRFAQCLDVPVVAGAPFGHRPHNEAFILGSLARVEGDSVSISYEAAAEGCSV